EGGGAKRSLRLIHHDGRSVSRPGAGMGPVMRRLVVAVALIGFATGGWAADYETDFPTLRGSTPYIPAPPRHMNWSGFYGGGQVGYGASLMDFSKSASRITAFDPNNTFTAPFGSVSTWVSLS